MGGTRISDVTILRLKFESDGKVYNLGVVDNIQHNENKPPVEGNIFDDLKDKVNDMDWKDILIFILVVIALIVLAPVLIPFLTLVLKLLWKGLVFLFKIIIWPFKTLFSKKE